jgi:hypothetical protein
MFVGYGGMGFVRVCASGRGKRGRKMGGKSNFFFLCCTSKGRRSIVPFKTAPCYASSFFFNAQ